MAYEDDVRIDEQALDVEWLDQPRLMISYCEVAAKAHMEVDLAEERLEFVQAQLDRDVRADPKAAGLGEKVTEGSIKAAILIHADYRAASEDVIRRKYEARVADGVVRAFDQRKTALESLVRLHGQSYFSGPAVPHDLSAERAKRDRNAQHRVRIGRPAQVVAPPERTTAPTLRRRV